MLGRALLASWSKVCVDPGSPVLRPAAQWTLHEKSGATDGQSDAGQMRLRRP